MAVDLRGRATWADDALRAMADPERKRATAGYFPTSMEVLGVSAPKMRTVLRQLLQDLKGEPPERVLELAWLLRSLETHEARQVAFELFDRRPDARRILKTLEIRRLGAGNDNWASVDTFASYVSGPAWREGQLSDRQILLWAGMRNHWWRRTAAVSTVALNLKSRGGTGDVERTLMVCRKLARDQEPLVAKAVSWALRALVTVNPERVRAFLARYGHELPALVRREVTSKLETGRKNR